jgi:branched-chain amino acid aminotransferase
MAFNLDSYPVVYRAKFERGAWREEFLEKPHKSPADEAALPESERAALASARNFFADMPLVSYTTQYGLSCFEGIKALPQKSGGLAMFRPDQNAARFARSMAGLYMPVFPENLFTAAVIETVKRNAALGFSIGYDASWEKDSYLNASSIYIRPFAYTEGGIGVNTSKEPWVVIICSPVTGYFKPGHAGAVITERIRATPKGTGWIKAASNYVISALAKHEAEQAGYMECIYLDAAERTYIEEGSSCNIFFVLKSGELVTPELGDTILPGITRASIIELAKEKGVTVQERKISWEEVQSEAAECFVSGTAAGATPIQSLARQGRKVVFSDGKTGAFTAWVGSTLKGIQYGALPDRKGWLAKVC